ncbi:hypothetical protein GCM10009555_017270 [Acrocarpospora macrocephala]|uniref:Uncharacterized protein n=1 Tax=Acrocarpospora macrocephala TaxID=150177 RepID=A0A5M3WE99_9ACTN|nr:hypothetical protein [Acrocarpospora macrocephala]GES07387.1 hypothetical protein Amac_009820 [Acrocarpospora macrocephala]
MTYPYEQPAQPPRKRRRGGGNLALIIVSAVAAVALIAVAFLAYELLQRPAGQSGAATVSTPSAQAEQVAEEPTGPPAQPRTRAAVKAAAEALWDSYAVGDYGTYWDAWAAADKKVVSRKDYQRRHRLCPSSAEGINWTVKRVTVKGERATVRAQRLYLIDDYTFVYEDGRWRYRLQPDIRKEYQTQTIDQIVAQAEAEGQCA